MKAAGSTAALLSSFQDMLEGAAQKAALRYSTASVSLLTATTALWCQMLGSISPSTCTSPSCQPIIRMLKAFERKMPREYGLIQTWMQDNWWEIHPTYTKTTCPRRQMSFRITVLMREPELKMCLLFPRVSTALI